MDMLPPVFGKGYTYKPFSCRVAPFDDIMFIQEHQTIRENSYPFLKTLKAACYTFLHTLLRLIHGEQSVKNPPPFSSSYGRLVQWRSKPFFKPYYLPCF
jgi:hypothetical protein